MKLASALVLCAVVVGSLAGCSGIGGPTVTKSSIASAAAKTLAKEIGATSPPPFDCGTGDTMLTVGQKFNCTVTDTTVNETFDAVVTITKLKGVTYTLDVQVAKTPNKNK